MTGSDLSNMPPAKCHHRVTHDRRSHRRFPVSVDLEYSLLLPEGHVQVGRGRTINLSSGGVLFEAEASVPVNMPVELSIFWPLRTGEQAQVELHATGKTVRAKGRQVAVKFDRSRFRTTRLRKQRRTTGNGR
jgi:PilZ domain-containing protein